MTLLRDDNLVYIVCDKRVMDIVTQLEWDSLSWSDLMKVYDPTNDKSLSKWNWVVTSYDYGLYTPKQRLAEVLA